MTLLTVLLQLSPPFQGNLHPLPVPVRLLRRGLAPEPLGRRCSLCVVRLSSLAADVFHPSWLPYLPSGAYLAVARALTRPKMALLFNAVDGITFVF